MKQETIDRIRKYITDRDWEQFQTPANLAKSVSIEANELLDCFQWNCEMTAALSNRAGGFIPIRFLERE